MRGLIILWIAFIVSIQVQRFTMAQARFMFNAIDNDYGIAWRRLMKVAGFLVLLAVVPFCMIILKEMLEGASNARFGIKSSVEEVEVFSMLFEFVAVYWLIIVATMLPLGVSIGTARLIGAALRLDNRRVRGGRKLERSVTRSIAVEAQPRTVEALANLQEELQLKQGEEIHSRKTLNATAFANFGRVSVGRQEDELPPADWIYRPEPPGGH